jgi:TDG/mug DNA glycosylase family protein
MEESDNQLQGLPPVIDTSCSILVLGSMPGGLSLSKQEYYGNPRNHFWRLIYAIYGNGTVPTEQYEERLNFALAKGVALWDVLASCERAGSLDSNIRNPVVNNFGMLLNNFPGLERIYFNGQTAEKLYRRLVLPHLIRQGIGGEIRYRTLPSSSPARATVLEAKLESWRVLADS